MRCEGEVVVQLDQGVPGAALGGRGAEAGHVGHDGFKAAALQHVGVGMSSCIRCTKECDAGPWLY